METRTNKIFMSFLRVLLFSLVAILWHPLLVSGQVTVGTGQGVSFNQLNFPSFQTPVLDSDTGVINVNIQTLKQSTGMSSGYLNVYLNGDWVVQNLPVFPESEYPYSEISTDFDLGVTSGTDISTISADVVFSDDPLTNSPAASRAPSSTVTVFPVGDSDVVIGGEGESPATSPPKPPDLTDIFLGDPRNTDAIIQFDHPNIEAAVNQCMPASIANSLQFLENTTDLVVPEDNVMGLKGDDSLVGKLDTTIDRFVPDTTDRRDDNAGGVGAVKGLKGKMEYLIDAGLGDKVKTTHHIDGSPDNVCETKGTTTLTSESKGTKITIGDIMDALKKGKDVEIGYIWPDGGHAVEVIGAGITNGKPWIIHASDLDQDSDSKGAGPSGYRFEYLEDPDKDGLYNLSGSDREIYRMFVQEYTPPPTPVMLGVDVFRTWGDLSHLCCINTPGPYLYFSCQGSMATLADTHPYFPLTGYAQDGMLSLSSTGTVAGWPNVQSSFTGTLYGGPSFGCPAPCPSILPSGEGSGRSLMASESDTMVISGTIKVGSNGALPGGQSLNFDVNLTLPAGDTTTISTDTTIETGATTTIDPGDSLVVSSGNTLTVNGTLDNDSTETITIENGAVLDIFGIFDNDGTVDNQGTININPGAFLDNDGTITNSAGATIDNDGSVTIDVDGVIDNNGTIDIAPNAFMYNGGAINNDCDGVINGTVSGTAAENTCLIPFNVTGIDTDLNAPAAVGADVKITILTTRTQGNPHYRWFANTFPFTAWETLADWTIFNDSETWSPGAAIRYVVLAHVAEVGETTNFHQGGFVFEPEGSTTNPIQILEVTTDIDYPQAVGTAITLSATANGGSGGTLYYRFFYRLRMGTWTAVGPWNEDGEDTWTPQEEGVYTVVVHVSEDNTVASNGLNQAGMTVTIGQ